MTVLSLLCVKNKRTILSNDSWEAGTVTIQRTILKGILDVTALSSEVKKK